MFTKYSPYLASLVHDAALKSFWRKTTLRTFLRNCNISENYISMWAEGETKREFLDRLFANLVSNVLGKACVVQMAEYLSVQTTFPDLEGYEDSTLKISAAKASVKSLCDYLATQNRRDSDQKEQADAREKFIKRREETLRSQNDLHKMQDRFQSLVPGLGTADAGYKFQEWFYDLMDFCEIESRRPYNAMGRQIDGSVTFDGTTYLVELKFTSSQADVTEIDSFHKKVTSKADNTMGIMISISGYSSVAVDEASRERTPLLLLDCNHIWPILSGTYNFTDVIARVRRHASQTGRAYLAMSDFSG